jgi:hypothetical protein
MRRVRQNEAKPLSPKKMLLRDPGTVNFLFIYDIYLTFSTTEGKDVGHETNNPLDSSVLIVSRGMHIIAVISVLMTG